MAVEERWTPDVLTNIRLSSATKCILGGGMLFVLFNMIDAWMPLVG